MWVLFLILSIVFLSTTVLFIWLSIRASRKIQSLEFFFYDTLEDIRNSADIFDALVNRHSLLIDDPDIIKIRQVFAVTLDILGDYINNGQRYMLNKKEKKEKKKEK